MVIIPGKIVRGIALACPFYFLGLWGLVAQDLSSQLIWEDLKAVGISISTEIGKDQHQELDVYLQNKSTPVLGKWQTAAGSYNFYPVVSFTYGLSYQLRLEGKTIGYFNVPVPGELENPQVLQIYPTGNELPANMLKIHIQFSKSMQEGRAVHYVKLVNDKDELVPEVFLDLQPELWNADQNALTLWLDPGRIKRDLQPNLKMGAPLIEGKSYKIVISADWKSQQGMALQGNFVKEFTVGAEDREKPDVRNWRITYPAVNSRDALTIDFNETLDATLASSAIHIYLGERQLSGQVKLSGYESSMTFEPESSWQSGEYKLVVETRLEDLAGNNLHRLFDRDLLNGEEDAPEDKQIYISFSLPEVQDP